MKQHLIRSLTVGLGLFGASEAFAGGEIFDPSVSTCTGADCSSVLLSATVTSFGPSAGKWIAEVFASSGECLRVFVPSQFTDLETVVVAPNGSAFRNDDGGGLNRPLVKISPTPNNGWYTVSISHFAGNPVTGNFSVAYGRYPAGNPNCASATPPVSTGSGPAKASGGVAAPQAGHPGR
jgi:hypothetical protein